MNQRSIENAVGIDDDVAKYMMEQKTDSARNAMSLLQMQTNSYDPCGFELLKASVRDCKKETKQAAQSTQSNKGE